MTTSSIDDAPRWSVADVYESVQSCHFLDAVERAAAAASALEATFDIHGIRAIDSRPVSGVDGRAADEVIDGYNTWHDQVTLLVTYVHAIVTTNSYDERAQALATELATLSARDKSLLARLVEWVAALGPDELATVSERVRDHLAPLLRLSRRADHQMSESEETLYAQLALCGSAAWARVQADVTSQLHATVDLVDGRGSARLAMAAVRGLATHADPVVRRSGYDAEMAAWPAVLVTCAAAINSVKGEAIVVNQRRRWPSPLDASLYSNSVNRATFEAMQCAVDTSLGDFRRWMRAKARLHGHDGALPWWDLQAPLPFAAGEISWRSGVSMVREAFHSYDPMLGGLVDRAIEQRWIDAEPRDGKRGGAFCKRLIGDRSLVFVNWTGTVESAMAVAHELGHAVHNTHLAWRTPLQRRVPMTLAETASNFCETLLLDAVVQGLQGADRLAALDVSLRACAQTVVDIRSRLDFETHLYAIREQRSVGVLELNELMLAAQRDAYGDGLVHATAHRYMWAVKPHYYTSSFYNWPYTFGLLLSQGLFARYREDPDAFRPRLRDALSRAGIDSAEEMGELFDLDIEGIAFWASSLDVIRERIEEYVRLAEAVRP